MADEDPIPEEPSPVIESILTSIKRLLGIEETYTQFDPDIVLSINTVFSTLLQLGVGPSTGFVITGKDEKWSDFIGDRTDIELVKSYIWLKVRLLFDPPQNSYLVESIKLQIEECEWRLNDWSSGEV